MSLNRLLEVTKDEQSAIDFLRESKILRSVTPICTLCGKKMSVLVERYRCVNKHRQISFTYGSFFVSSSISYCVLIRMLWCWCYKIGLYVCEEMIPEISFGTFSFWSNRLRSICSQWIVKSHYQIGGQDEVVEIDSFVLGQDRTRGGKKCPLDTVLIGFCPDTGHAFIKVLEKGDSQEEREEVMRRYIKLGSILNLKNWLSYNMPDYQIMPKHKTAPSEIVRYVEENGDSSKHRTLKKRGRKKKKISQYDGVCDTSEDDEEESDAEQRLRDLDEICQNQLINKEVRVKEEDLEMEVEPDDEPQKVATNSLVKITLVKNPVENEEKKKYFVRLKPGDAILDVSNNETSFVKNDRFIMIEEPKEEKEEDFIEDIVEYTDLQIKEEAELSGSCDNESDLEMQKQELEREKQIVGTSKLRKRLEKSDSESDYDPYDKPKRKREKIIIPKKRKYKRRIKTTRPTEEQPLESEINQEVIDVRIEVGEFSNFLEAEKLKPSKASQRKGSVHSFWALFKKRYLAQNGVTRLKLQGFCDEMMWRSAYGQTGTAAFFNILHHISIFYPVNELRPELRKKKENDA